eukprot:152159_1
MSRLQFLFMAISLISATLSDDCPMCSGEGGTCPSGCTCIKPSAYWGGWVCAGSCCGDNVGDEDVNCNWPNTGDNACSGSGASCPDGCFCSQPGAPYWNGWYCVPGEELQTTANIVPAVNVPVNIPDVDCNWSGTTNNLCSGSGGSCPSGCKCWQPPTGGWWNGWVCVNENAPEISNAVKGVNPNNDAKTAPEKFIPQYTMSENGVNSIFSSGYVLLALCFGAIAFFSLIVGIFIGKRIKPTSNMRKVQDIEYL